MSKEIEADQVKVLYYINNLIVNLRLLNIKIRIVIIDIDILSVNLKDGNIIDKLHLVKKQLKTNKYFGMLNATNYSLLHSTTLFY